MPASLTYSDFIFTDGSNARFGAMSLFNGMYQPILRYDQTAPTQLNYNQLTMSPDNSTLYAFSGGVMSKTDIATGVRTTTTAVSGTNGGIAVTPDNTTLWATTATSPFIYGWDASTLATVTGPGTLPTGIGKDVDFSPDGTLMAVAHVTTPFVTIYNYPALTKITNPATLPPTNGTTCKFSPNGQWLAVGTNSTSPRLIVYNVSTWTPVTLVGSVTAGGDVNQVLWAPDSSRLFVLSSTTGSHPVIFETTGWTNVTGPTPAVSFTGSPLSMVVFTKDIYATIGVNVNPIVIVYDTYRNTTSIFETNRALTSSAACKLNGTQNVRVSGTSRDVNNTLAARTVNLRDGPTGRLLHSVVSNGSGAFDARFPGVTTRDVVVEVAPGNVAEESTFYDNVIPAVY